MRIELRNNRLVGVDSGGNVVPIDFGSVSAEKGSIGPNGEIDIIVDGTGADINSAISGLPSRDHWGTVKCIGNFTVEETIEMKSYTFLDLSNARLKLGGGMPSSSRMIDYDTGVEQGVIFGGVLDGNKSSFSGNGNIGLRVQGAGFTTNWQQHRNRVLHTQIKNFESLGLNATSRRAYYERVSVDDCGGVGIKIQSTDQTFINPASQGCQVGLQINSSHNTILHPIVDTADLQGIIFSDASSGATHNRVYGGYSELNDGVGVIIKDTCNYNTLRDMELIENGQDGGADAMQITGDDNRVIDCDYYDNQGTTTQDDAILVNAGANRTRLRGNDYQGNPKGINDNGTHTILDGVVSGTYPGDGSTFNSVTFGFRPSVVYIEGSDGTLYEARDTGLGAISGSSYGGDITIRSNGFSVGDGSSDADPNTLNETYKFEAWRSSSA